MTVSKTGLITYLNVSRNSGLSVVAQATVRVQNFHKFYTNSLPSSVSTVQVMAKFPTVLDSFISRWTVLGELK